MGLLSTIGAASGRAFGLTRVGAAIRDAYFNLTTLLLPGNGTNGAQNNTFLDSSSNNFTITRNGNTTQGTFSPFSQTGWSVNLDGTGDYLTVADNAVLDMGSSNFTMEFWTYITGTLGTYQALVSKRATTGTYGGISLYVTSSRTLNLQATLNGSTWGVDITTTSTVNLNEWAHIAVVRNGNVWTVYINGTSGGTTTVAGTVPDNASAFTIGAGAADGGHNMVASYISNFRLVKGTALYTANFTPTTSPLTTTSQGATATEVELLTCQGNRFVDISDNAFTITVNGNPSVQAFSPFAPTAAYDAATVGGSGYFDGSGDYLSNSSDTIIPSTGDFTAQFWIYPTQVSSLQYLIATTNNSGNKLHLYINSSAYVGVQTGSSYKDSSTTKVVANAWNHIACTRTGSTYALFVNGVSQSISGSGTMASTLDVTPTYIAARDAGAGAISGYLGSSKITTVVETISVPTAPYTSDGNTRLLTNFTNAGITDATAKNDLETVGNAQISTTQSKFGGSSMYFDGTGDYLVVGNMSTNPNLALLAGDFTIEYWYYPLNTSIHATLNNLDDGAGNGSLWILMNGTFSGGSKVQFGYNTGGANGNILFGTGTFTANAWYHVAICRSGSNLRCFINGTQEGSTSTALGTGSIVAYNRNLVIGATFTGGAYTAYNLNGYLDDFRVTKFARYTANFTAPTTAFALQ